jgi:hypothetical protein
MAQTKTKPKTSPKRRSASSQKQSSRKRTDKAKPVPTVAMSNAADKATTAVGNAADKAKMPLVAGGAALAGAAGGLAFGARHARRHSRIERAVKLAGEFQRARNSTNGGNNKQRSPLEVVLEGLTARRSRA